MPIVNITTWPTKPEVKQELLRNITRVVHETTGAPLDKITVYVQEVAPADWADAGSIGSEKDFAQASRRQQYPVNQTAE